MKVARSIFAIMTIAFGLPAQLEAASTDPEVILYRFPGVRDNGGADQQGVATVFHCTNFSGVTETIRFVTRNFSGFLVGNSSTTMAHLYTLTAVTHHPVAYGFDVSLSTGNVNQGTTAIAATSINIICTAMTIDASTVAPIGVALRGIRFNPVPGSQE